MRRLVVLALLLSLVACIDRGLWAQMRSEPIINKEPPVSELLGERLVPPAEKFTPGQPGGFIIEVWGSALPMQQLVDFYFGNFFERYQLREMDQRRPGFERQFRGHAGDITVEVGMSFAPVSDSRFTALVGPLKKAPAGTQSYAEVLVASS